MSDIDGLDIDTDITQQIAAIALDPMPDLPGTVRTMRLADALTKRIAP